MHELAIAQNIIEAVRRALEAHGGGVVRLVRLRIGELSGVEVESLRFGYEMSVSDTELAGSELEIERIAVVCECEQCGLLFTPDRFIRICPACSSRRCRITQGAELEIVDFEVE